MKYYVYVLIDPRDKYAFYVGKGSGSRPWEHLTADSIDDISKLISQIPIQEREGSFDLREAVKERVLAIRSSQNGVEPIVQVLTANDCHSMTEETAFAVEAALIDTLSRTPGHPPLLNRVAGQRWRFGDLRALEVVSQAQPVTLPADRNYVFVSVNGVWGGADSTGAFAGADPRTAWENARHAWSVDVAWREQISILADSTNPVLLVGLAKDPTRRRKNIVACVEELFDTHVIQENDKTHAANAGGIRFVKPDRERTSTAQLRDCILNQEAMFEGSPVKRPESTRYLGPWNPSK